MKFALSSCWNSHRHDDGYAMLQEIAGMGFRWVELSHGIRMSLVPGILKAVDEGMIRVSSVHNFCPLPVGIMGAAPNLYEPTAVSRRERILWLSNTLKTVEFAGRVQCDRIVLHSGRVRLLWGNPGAGVEAAFDRAEGTDSSELRKVRTRGLKRLNRKKAGFMKRLRESYSLVAERARDAGVCFGVENREGFEELPLDADMAAFQAELKEHGVFGYWHDCGHAELKQRMGLLDHRKFLEELRPYLVGFHLHDVSSSNRDHQVPGTGVIDWSIMADHIREGDCVVMELSPRLTAEEVLEGRTFLRGAVPALSGE